MTTDIRSDRTTARVIGALFLGAIFAYGTGMTLTTSVLGSPDPLAAIAEQPSTFRGGAGLMLVNSVIVAVIGVLSHPLLARRSPTVAVGYLGARLVEAVVLGVGVISLLALVSVSGPSAGAASLQHLVSFAVGMNGAAYQVAMAALGFGSLFFTFLLLRERMVPRFLAAWGFVGYAVFLAGAVLEILGFAGWGLVLSMPGGLFELAFGIWLIVRGFSPGAVADA